MLHNTFIRKRKPFRHHHHCQLILMYQQCRGRRLKSVFISSFILAILLYSTPHPQNCTSKMTLSEKKQRWKKCIRLNFTCSPKNTFVRHGNFQLALLYYIYMLFARDFLLASFNLYVLFKLHLI